MNKKLKLEELNRLSVLEFKEAEKDPIIVLLDDVRSLNNIGSVFRTCDAMGIKKMYLCGITVSLLIEKLEKQQSELLKV
jgi:tRNA G18 (ribose-2'-O)-methylase SpoU